VNVREDGPPDGPVLLLLHGFSGSLHWFDRVVPLLADRYRIVRVDLLGHGATGGRGVDAPRQAQTVAAVLDALDVADLTVVGHSFGADVAVELAESCPRVSRLVIVAQAPDYTDARLPRAGALVEVAPLRLALPPLLRTLAGLAGPLAVRRFPADGRELARQALRDFRALDGRMFHVVLVERRERMARRPLDEQVRAAGKPTLVVLCGRDHFYGARSAHRYAAAGARVEVLAESGHSPFVDAPARMAQLLGEFAA
jgi:pimeloyl-ACP methyl ester carboxylesterase